MVKNPEAKAILECLNRALNNMLCTTRCHGKDNLRAADIEQFVINAAQAVSSTHYNIFGSSPGVAIFG